MLIAQMNVGTALHDLDGEGMADFTNRLDEINALAEGSPGFVWRLKTEAGNAMAIRPSADPRFIVNMSVWESVEALFAYVYRSDHRGVMVRRREWFAKPDGPYQVLWWIADDHRPSVKEGLARLEHLKAHGPSSHAFTFQKAFPPTASGPVDLHPEPWCVGWA